MFEKRFGFSRTAKGVEGFLLAHLHISKCKPQPGAITFNQRSWLTSAAKKSTWDELSATFIMTNKELRELLEATDPRRSNHEQQPASARTLMTSQEIIPKLHDGGRGIGPVWSADEEKLAHQLRASKTPWDQIATQLQAQHGTSRSLSAIQARYRRVARAIAPDSLREAKRKAPLANAWLSEEIALLLQLKANKEPWTTIKQRLKTLSGVERSIKAIQKKARDSHPSNKDLSNSQDDIDHTEDPLVIPAEKPNGLGNSTTKDGRAGNTNKEPTSKRSNHPWTVEQESWLRKKAGNGRRLDRKSLTQKFEARFGFSRTEIALVCRAHRLRKAQ